MNSSSSSRFLKYGRWFVRAAGATSVAVAVAYFSPGAGPAFASTSFGTPGWTPNKPANVPDIHPKWDYNWDKREQYSPSGSRRKRSISGGGGQTDSEGDGDKPKTSTASRYLILVRHGQYNMNNTTTDEERYLTPLGREQASLVGKRLKNSGIKFDSIVSSDMTRAKETTEIMLKEMCQDGLLWETPDPILREGAPCLPEPPVSTWHPELHYYEDGARIEAAFRKYFHRADPEQEKDSFEIIVCHANVIRYFTCRALQFPGDAWLRISLKNCSLTILCIRPSGRVSLQALGDYGHLPVDKVTTT